MAAVRLLLLLTLLSPYALADDEMTLTTAKNLSMERCLQLPPGEIVTRCPTVAGRFFEIDHQKVALADRVDQRKGSFLCDPRCRRIVVLDYELRGVKKRDAQKVITASELVRRIATASSVKLGDEFGALQLPPLPPRTCVDQRSRGCAVQAIRIRGVAPDRSPNPVVRRRLWLVEDVSGTTLACSDAQLTRCDELTAAGWSALALTLRPSSLAPPQPPPEIDPPDTRSDRHSSSVLGAGGGEGAESLAGSLDPWARSKAPLPSAPSRTDVAKLAHGFETTARGCVAAAIAVHLLFSGQGSLLSLSADQAAPPEIACLTGAAKKLAFPRFAGNTYQLEAMVLPGPVNRAAPPRKRAARPPR
jgi:hypothetical protein